jgi:hypothetical protein
MMRASAVGHNACPSTIGGPSTRNTTSGASTTSYATVVNQPVSFFHGFGCTHRIAAMDLTHSCVHFRMVERGTDTMPNTNQMPPIGTDVPDPTGIGALEAWIAALPPPN